MKPKRIKKIPCGALCEAGEGTPTHPEQSRNGARQEGREPRPTQNSRVETRTGSPDPPERREMCDDKGLWYKSYVGIGGLFDYIFGCIMVEK